MTIKIPPIRATEFEENPKAVAHFFNLLGRGDWYVLEGEKRDDGDWLFFGYVKSPLGQDCDEYGYFTLSELESILVIGFDKEFKPTPMQKILNQ